MSWPPTRRGRHLLFGQIFSKNCMKIKTFWARGGHMSLAPSTYTSVNDSVSMIIKWVWHCISIIYSQTDKFYLYDLLGQTQYSFRVSRTGIPSMIHWAVVSLHKYFSVSLHCAVTLTSRILLFLSNIYPLIFASAVNKKGNF